MLKIGIILGILAIGGVCFNLTQYSQADYILISERFELIDNNENYLTSIVFKNFKYNRTHYGVNMSGTFEHDLHEPLMMVMQGYKFSSNEYRLFPLYLPFDMCDALKRNIFGCKNLYDCGNMFRCPIKRGHFSICNWGPDYAQYPPYIPKGRYRLDIEWRYSTVTILKYNWYIAVTDVPLKY